jgi:tetratricopeptide (TPR) repeat protein
MVNSGEDALRPPQAPGNGAPLISGRDRELASLDKALTEAAGGRGRTVLIKGEPGIGKTTLAEAFSDRARERGANILWGRSWEAGGAPAYWPWIQVLRSALALPEAKEYIEAVRPFVDVVATLVPEVAGPGGVQKPQAGGEQERFTLFDAVSRVLQSCARAAPLVVVLDDLHAAEDASLLLLRFLARDIRTAPVLIVGTHRDKEVQVDPRAREIFAEVARDGEVMTLSGLDPDSIASVLEEAAGAPPSDTLRESLHQITEGNPFYANEIMRLLIEEGQIEARLDLTRRALPVPDSVSALVLRRMKNLDPQVHRVLTIAAVLGREFQLRPLSKAAGLDVRSLKQLLEGATTEGILRRSGHDGYLFDHNLIREALYEALSDDQRSTLHAQIGAVLEELQSEEPDAHLTEIAHHYLRAALTDTRPTFEYAIRAGERAVEVLAYEQAVNLFEEALALADTAAPSKLERGELLLRLGEAHVRAGHVAEASERFVEAVDIARAERSSNLLVKVALAHSPIPIEGGIVNAWFVALAEEAIAALGPGDSIDKAVLMSRLAAELSFSVDKADVAKKDSLSLEGLEMALRMDAPREIGIAMRFRFTSIFSPDRLDESLQLARDILQFGIQQHDDITQLLGRVRLAAVYLSLGKMNAVEAELKEVQRLSKQVRQPIYASPVAFLTAAIASLRADIPTAFALSDKALAAYPDVPNALGAHLLQHVGLRWETDGGGDLEFFVRAAMEQRPGLRRAWTSALVNIFARTDRPEEARALLRDMIEDLPNAPMNISYVTTLHCTVDAIRVLRDPFGCAPLYDALLPFRDQHFLQMMLAPVAYYGSVERDLATLASILERWDAAEEHFERSLREHARIGARTFLAWTQVEFGEMLLRRGRAEDAIRARELLEEGLRSAERLGLKILARFATPLLEERGSQETSAEAETPSIVREGEYVTITWGGEIVRLRHTKGVTYLAKLLANPGREIHVLEVASESAVDPKVVPGEMGLASDDVGAALDPQAKAAYKRRIDDLREEIEEAARFNDPGRAERAQEELDFITREIAGAVGLGGRDRKKASNAERARVNVTKRVKETIGKIAADAPRLGRHLSISVKTGTFLSYGEEDADLPDWDIDTSQLR